MIILKDRRGGRGGGQPGDADGSPHTLKGVAGNLGLNGLMEACAEMVSQLRSNSMEGALAAYPAVKEKYGKGLRSN